MHDYTVQTPSGAGACRSQDKLVVGVERFRGRDIMRDDRIVYYQSPTQLNFYQQHRWSADPTAMLAELCQRWLEQTGSSPRFGWHLTGSPWTTA
jgi:uncharacterized lipoprotein YmbA